MIYKIESKDIIKNPPQDMTLKFPQKTFEVELRALMIKYGLKKLEAKL